MLCKKSPMPSLSHLITYVLLSLLALTPLPGPHQQVKTLLSLHPDPTPLLGCLSHLHRQPPHPTFVHVDTFLTPSSSNFLFQCPPLLSFSPCSGPGWKGKRRKGEGREGKKNEPSVFLVPLLSHWKLEWSLPSLYGELFVLYSSLLHFPFRSLLSSNPFSLKLLFT